MKIKKRLDQLVTERFGLSRTYAQSLIMQGKVLVDGIPATKAGMLYVHDILLTVHDEQPKYVSRAGYKLEHALEHFHIDVHGLVALDAGLSTGGFTDCLLQRGIKKVYGIDVGYGQVHEKIRHDPRVVVMERTNLRHLESLPEPIDLVTLDLSFISVLKVMPALIPLLSHSAQLVVLIKPQFEAGKHEVGKGGIVTHPAVRKQVCEKIVAGIDSYGFVCKGIVESALKGTDGNTEFLGYFVRNFQK